MLVRRVLFQKVVESVFGRELAMRCRTFAQMVISYGGLGYCCGMACEMRGKDGGAGMGCI